jgi:predicted phosphodiesterase
MKYLVFGDVHGNLPALELVLAKEKNNYDQLISHGDVVNYGPWSNECVQLLEAGSCICLSGNHEEYYLQGFYPGSNEVAKLFFQFCFPFFNQFETIKKYGQSLELAGFTIRHTINNQYLFPDSDFSKLDIDRNYIFGHSHYPFLKVVNGFELINTGSIGQNRKFLNRIDYVLLNSDGRHEPKSLVYDVDKVIDEMERRKYPELCLNYYRSKQRC